MGKLAIISDLHVDINQLGQVELAQLIEVLQAKGVTRVHLAGDTANTMAQVLSTVAFIEEHQLPVTYNLGNHEMPELEGNQRIEAYPERHYLNQAYLNLSDSHVLLAFNGWYDYSYALEKDHSKILAAKNLYWYDRFIQRGMDDPSVQAGILEALEVVLTQLQEQGKRVIIATHFVPRRDFIVYQTGKYERWNALNAFLGSEKTGALFERYEHIQQVVFGHTHRQFGDRDISGTIYSCRPFGYYYEWHLTREFVLSHHLMTSFNPMKVRGALKAHQGAFAEYRKSHLKDEFERGMTVIDY